VVDKTAPAIRLDAGIVRVQLPFTWLRDVWGNVLAVILDRFCLHASRTAEDAWTLATVDRGLTGQHTLTISG
jgi:hypothetical protein